MSRTRTAIAALSALAIAAPAASADARPVSLDDARYAPHDLAYVQPGATVTLHPCGRGIVSDVSAYGARGRALSAQRRSSWRAATGRVTYRRGTFRNASRRPVLVAVWCG